MKYIISLLIIAAVSIAHAKEIALSFDDAPRGDTQIFTGEERTKKLIQTLSNHNIQAVFFVNSERFKYPGRIERIQAYNDAGHIIANHSYNHADLRKTPVEDYIVEIERAHNDLHHFSNFKKWFRFPYLREGDTIEIRDRVREYLSATNYMNGYVTVDNYDYYVDMMVQRSLKRGNSVRLDRACDMLVDIMWESISHYEELALKHLGKVRHNLLMHENDIEALCLGDLINKIKSEGWKIVSPEYAYADPILSRVPDTLYLGQGRVAALVHEKTGVKHRNKWESSKNLEAEFKRRKIAR